MPSHKHFTKVELRHAFGEYCSKVENQLQYQALYSMWHVRHDLSVRTQNIADVREQMQTHGSKRSNKLLSSRDMEDPLWMDIGNLKESLNSMKEQVWMRDLLNKLADDVEELVW